MPFLYTFVFTLVYTVSELLPFSGEAHRFFLRRYFAVSFTESDELHLLAFINLGLMAAIIAAYIKELRMISYGLRGNPKKKRLPNTQLSRRFLLLIGTAIIPVLFISLFEQYTAIVSGNALVISVAVILNGIMLYLADIGFIGSKTESNTSFLDAFLIGFSQIFSAIPGLSAVSLSLTAGISGGLSDNFAVQFTYILALPLFLIRSFRCLDAAGALSSSLTVLQCCAALLISGFTGYWAIRLVRLLADKARLKSLSYYCFCVGAVMFILSFIS